VTLEQRFVLHSKTVSSWQRSVAVRPTGQVRSGSMSLHRVPYLLLHRNRVGKKGRHLVMGKFGGWGGTCGRETGKESGVRMGL